MRKILLAIIAVCLAVPVHGYIAQKTLVNDAITQVKWSSMPITWKLNATQGTRVTGARTFATVVQNSFDTWEALKNSTANIDFTLGGNTTASYGYDQVNIVKTNLTQTDWDNSGAGSALAVTLVSTATLTGEILDADIIFNPAENFSLDATTPSDKYDFESVLTHEVGHFLGLDHSAILSATMFPRVGTGVSLPRVLSVDDVAGVSSIYPTASYLSKGSITGTVRLSNTAVYGAIVVAVNASGQPVAHGVSDPQGNYTIAGLDAGTYTVYAEPMDSPYQFADQAVLSTLFPNSTASTTFSTRFR
jgi:hypothetical protein